MKNKIILNILILLFILDLILTLYGISKGYKEINPLYNYDNDTFLLMKTSILISLIFMSIWIKEKPVTNKIYTYIMIAIIILFIVIIINNAMVII
jgi:quinol-cytochrome oxidoreductase complex cytochrome b subunit